MSAVVRSLEHIVIVVETLGIIVTNVYINTGNTGVINVESRAKRKTF